MNCLNCGKELTGKQKKFCSEDCKRKDFDRNRRKDYSRIKGRTLKWYLSKKLGGECAICGYKNNLAALNFHHINPVEKSFEVDQRSCANRSMEELTKEVAKCILLCSNCHMEAHNKELTIDDNMEFASKESLLKWTK